MPSLWQLGKDLKGRNAHMLETKDLSDCTFMVEGEEVKAHRVLVSAASPVLQEKLEAAGDKAVILANIELDIFKMMLKYIYTDAFDASYNMAYRLGVAAKDCQLPLLAEQCSKYMATSPLPVKDVAQAYELAICINDKELAKKCEEIIKTKTKEVLETSSFLHVSVCTVAAIFSLEPLNIDSELELLKAADLFHKRVSKQGVECSDDCAGPGIRTALEQVRLLSLSPRQFVEGRTELLDDGDACAVLANLVSTHSKVPMPEGFSTKRFRQRTINDYKTEQTTNKDIQGIADVLVTEFYLKEPLKIGTHVILWATAPAVDRKWFIINLRHAISEPERRSANEVLHMAQVALHLRPYYSGEIVIRNSVDHTTGLVWGPEEKYYEKPFPFVPGQQFKLEIIMEEKQTVWLVDDKYFFTYVHRTPSPLGATRVQVMNLEDPTLLLAVASQQS